MLKSGVMTDIRGHRCLNVIRQMIHGLLIGFLLGLCLPDLLGEEQEEADALANGRKSIGVSTNSRGLLRGTRKIEATRICFYLVTNFCDTCNQANMALELKDKNEISNFLVLLNKNAEHPRLKVDQRRNFGMDVAIYGKTNEIDSVIYISRGYDSMTAFFEFYVKTGGSILWDIGGGETVNELEGWIKEKKIDLWSID